MGVTTDIVPSIGDPDLVEHLDSDAERLGPCGAAMTTYDLADLESDRQGRVQAGHRFLEHHGDRITTQVLELA